MKALDLFAGLGGMSFALTRFFDEIVAVENDPTAAEYHRANFPNSPVIEQDVMKLGSEGLPGVFDHVHASPPCQSFSQAHRGRKGKIKRDDSGMSQAVGQIIRTLGPETFTIENVPRYFKGPEYQSLIDALGGDYVVQTQELKAVDCGLSQSRIRGFALGVRSDKFRFLVPPPRRVNTPGWATLLPEYIDKKLVVAGELAPWQHRVIKKQHPGLGCGVFLVKRDGYRKGKPILYPTGKPTPTITASRWHQLDFLNIETGKSGFITPRGLAVLQGFPPLVKLPDNPGEAVRLVGNAVPPPLGLRALKTLGLVVKPEFSWCL